MDNYRITASTLAEYQRADMEPGYSPRETEVMRFEAPNYRAALREFRKAVDGNPNWFRPELVLPAGRVGSRRE